MKKDGNNQNKKEAGDDTLFFRCFLNYRVIAGSIVTNALELLNLSVVGGG